MLGARPETDEDNKYTVFMVSLRDSFWAPVPYGQLLKFYSAEACDEELTFSQCFLLYLLALYCKLNNDGVSSKAVENTGNSE